MDSEQPSKLLTKADEGMEYTDYSEDGVDLTLIRWMLSLTPAERLDVLQQQAQAILEIRAHIAGS